MISQKIINNITILIISLIFICFGGSLLYSQETLSTESKNPLIFACGVGMIGIGANIILTKMQTLLIPHELHKEILDIKRS